MICRRLGRQGPVLLPRRTGKGRRPCQLWWGWQATALQLQLALLGLLRGCPATTPSAAHWHPPPPCHAPPFTMLERHSLNPGHGDVCRDIAGLWACPTGCRMTAKTYRDAVAPYCVRVVEGQPGGSRRPEGAADPATPGACRAGPSPPSPPPPPPPLPRDARLRDSAGRRGGRGWDIVTARHGNVVMLRDRCSRLSHLPPTIPHAPCDGLYGVSVPIGAYRVLIGADPLLYWVVVLGCCIGACHSMTHPLRATGTARTSSPGTRWRS